MGFNKGVVQMKGQDVLFASNNDEWQTPQGLFHYLNDKFNFTMDLAASDTNHLAEKYYTKESNALLQDWQDEVAFCNPPYSIVGQFINKAMEQKDKAKVICMLVASRTDTKAFQNMTNAYVLFIKGRLKFIGAKHSAPFPSALIFLGSEINTVEKKLRNQILGTLVKWG